MVAEILLVLFVIYLTVTIETANYVGNFLRARADSTVAGTKRCGQCGRTM